MIVLAHVSDPHFDGGTRSAKRARRVMDFINGLPGHIDAILVTGDIADYGQPAEYEQARTTLISTVPLLSCPGNHDERSAYRADYLQEPGLPEDSAAPINRVHKVGDAVVAMCDSSVPGHPEGMLSDETLVWLQGVLDDAPPSAPIFIAFHHPPVLLYSPIVDPIRQHSVDRLADLVAGDNRIVALLCGHAHTSAVTTFAGVPLLVAPSVTSVLGPSWEGDDGPTGDPVVDYHVSPAVAFHVLDDDGRITTHFRTIPKPSARDRRGFRRSAHHGRHS